MYCLKTLLSVVVITSSSLGYLLAFEDVQLSNEMSGISEEAKNNAQTIMLFKHIMTEEMKDELHPDAVEDVVTKQINPHLVLTQICPNIHTVGDITDALKNASLIGKKASAFYPVSDKGFYFVINNKTYFTVPQHRTRILAQPAETKVEFIKDENQIINIGGVKFINTFCRYKMLGTNLKEARFIFFHNRPYPAQK